MRALQGFHKVSKALVARSPLQVLSFPMSIIRTYGGQHQEQAGRETGAHDLRPGQRRGHSISHRHDPLDDCVDGIHDALGMASIKLTGEGVCGPALGFSDDTIIQCYDKCCEQ